MARIKTIQMGEFEYMLLQTVKKLLDDISPRPVTMGMAAAFGTIYALMELSKFKAKLSKSPQGQIYLALVDIAKLQYKP